MIQYDLPNHWIKYSAEALSLELVGAKASVLSLSGVPYQKSWVEDLQKMELKREVAGTSRIEGADFTERELDAAMEDDPETLRTRSQRQARAVKETYQWIATIPDNRPMSQQLITEIHKRIIAGADDDHCPPGQLRGRDQNVNFGQPRHQGANGGQECEKAFERFTLALQRIYLGHDPLIQALAAHYHLAAIHPFLDGNGRTARALEALLLQRAGLRNVCFIAMSNYYYDEKIGYLTALGAVRAKNYDLTTFLSFGLKGISIQSRRLLDQIQIQVSKAIYRNLMFDLFGRLKTPRKRVIAKRQMNILKILLDHDSIELNELAERTSHHYYQSLKNPLRAFARDLDGLVGLGAIGVQEMKDNDFKISIRLDWPTQITETEFFQRIKEFPKARTYRFLQ